MNEPTLNNHSLKLEAEIQLLKDKNQELKESAQILQGEIDRIRRNFECDEDCYCCLNNRALILG